MARWLNHAMSLRLCAFASLRLCVNDIAKVAVPWRASRLRGSIVRRGDWEHMRLPIAGTRPACCVLRWM